MERLTEYHNGVAVIKGKRFSEAARKLAGYEDSEELSKEIGMEKITTEMMEHICDHICLAPKVVLNQEELDEHCSNCKMGNYVCDICNKYNHINDFVNSHAGKLLAMYRHFVFCDDCEYCQTEEDCRWCRNKEGLEGHLEAGSGCTRGKKVV